MPFALPSGPRIHQLDGRLLVAVIGCTAGRLGGVFGAQIDQVLGEWMVLVRY